MEFQFFVLKYANESLEERDCLLCVGRGLDRQAMLPIGLKFRRLITKGLLDTFLNLQFSSSPGAL